MASSDLKLRRAPAWTAGWWALMDRRLGIVPLPVLGLLALVLAGLLATGKVASDMLVNIAVLSVGGFACAAIGKSLPGLRQFGSAAILAIFVPSYLAYAHLLPAPLVGSITEFTKSSNFLYLFITAIIVGSIFGMDRHVLLTGFFKIFIPMAVGSVAAACIGTLTGAALGLGLHHSFFYLVLPVMAGGVGEGAIPLSMGYASIVHASQTEIFAQVLPPVMMGSLFAILVAGGLNVLGRRYPALTGFGQLEPGEQDQMRILVGQPAPAAAADLHTIGAATVTAVALYLAGVLAQRLIGLPAPVAMLFLAVALKLGYLVSPDLERGAFAVYRFFSVIVTYPLLFAIGVAMTPWDRLTAAVSLPNVLTILATVLTMVASFYAVARVVKLYPIETAIIGACRCGQGGTGDVAILTAADRMQLMPFAQIATRIGGAITVTLAIILLSRLG
jgi:Na+/citrate or Na+/malate symporter